MKKLGLVLCAVLVVFGSLALIAEASSPQQHWNQFCKFMEEKNPCLFEYKWGNHGNCVSFFAKKLNKSGPVKYCKWLEENHSWLFDCFYDNLGDCVSFHRNWK